MKKKMIVFTFLVLNRLILHHNSYSRAKCEKLSTLAMVSELGAFTLVKKLAIEYVEILAYI